MFQKATRYQIAYYASLSQLSNSTLNLNQQIYYHLLTHIFFYLVYWAHILAFYFAIKIYFDGNLFFQNDNIFRYNKNLKNFLRPIYICFIFKKNLVPHNTARTCNLVIANGIIYNNMFETNYLL